MTQNNSHTHIASANRHTDDLVTAGHWLLSNSRYVQALQRYLSMRSTTRKNDNTRDEPLNSLIYFLKKNTYFL